MVILIYVAVLVAPAFDPGSLFNTLENLKTVLASPFHLTWCDNTPKSIFIFLLIGLCAGAYVQSNAKKTRPGKEHGSARMHTPSEVKEIADKEYENNRILTQNVKLSVTGKKTPLSLNTLVLGGMGAGKSFYTLIPNLLQANTSFVVTDPSKELVKKVGWFLKYIKGYDVRVLDLENPESSFKYNFFEYIRNENDILKIVNIIFDATGNTRGGAKQKNSDPMWENMAKSWLLALVALLYYRGYPEEQNIETLVWLLDHDILDEDKYGNRVMTPVMALFDELEEQMPGNMASQNYRSATDGAVITIRGVKSTLRGRIAKFLLPSIQNLMSRDELDLRSIGHKKTALFLAVPSEDSSFNFIVSMIYAQLFPALYEEARRMPDNKLAVPVQFFIDEMKNFIMPEDFLIYLTTSRKHGISYMMFYQEIGQISSQFEKDEYKTLIGTCNTFVYLGGSGRETNKYISEWMGSETITSYSYNQTYGSRGSSGRSEQQIKREILTPDEIDTELRQDEALVYVKGYGWVKDKKNNPELHKNYKYTAGEKEGQIYDWSGKENIQHMASLAMNAADKAIKADFTIDIDKIESFKIEEKYNIRIYGGEEE